MEENEKQGFPPNLDKKRKNVEMGEKMLFLPSKFT
jgi:hypothetical protein